MIGPRVGIVAGPRVGIAAGISADHIAPPAGNAGFTTKDATSNIFVPATAAEFTSAGFAAPSSLWQCQEPSGNLVDTIGGKTLTASGSPAYQQAVASWARKAVGASGGASNQLFSNATMADVSVKSVAFLLYVLINQPVSSGQRCFHGAASGNAFEGVAASKVIRLRNGANAGNGTLDHTTAVHPILVVHDITNSVNVIYSDIEKKSITYGVVAGTTFQLQVGLAADTTSNTQALWMASWNGSSAEFTDATAKALLQALGWTVTGF